jgi:hypothetical protein
MRWIQLVLILLFHVASCTSEDVTCRPNFLVSPSAFVAFPSRSCKEVHFIRHAQGTHNEAEERAASEGLYADPADILLEVNSGKLYWDPELTEKGVKQCETLNTNFPALDTPIELVVVSPFYRTLQTAVLSIPALSMREDISILDGMNIVHPKLLVTELCRERIHHYQCDTHKVGPLSTRTTVVSGANLQTIHHIAPSRCLS